MTLFLVPTYAADGTEGGGGWGGFLRSVEVAEVQPGTDTETEAAEEEAVEEVETDEAETDHPETESDEVTSDGDETNNADEAQTMEDVEIDMGAGQPKKKLSELKNGYLRQSDYTKKTQELAAQRKEVETLRDSLKGAESLDRHIRDNPWLWQQINQALETFNTTGVAPIEEAIADAQYGHYINVLMRENNALKSQLGTLQGDYEGIKLSGSMERLKNDLRGEYGELVTDAYMEKLQERAKTEKLASETVREIAEGFLAKEKLKSTNTNVKKLSKQAEAKTIQKLQETKQKSPQIPKTAATVPSQATKGRDSKNWGDFLRSLSD